MLDMLTLMEEMSLKRDVSRNNCRLFIVLVLHSRALEVEAPLELIIDVDVTRISQLLINLLRNANKFTPEEGKISVTVDSSEEHFVFAVKDSGIGLSEEDMGKLFAPFPGIHHGLSVTSTGLGLAICKGIVDMHQGKIWVESEGPGKGSTFSFTLPLKKD
jgi:signal transduction histidine kinase